MKHKFSVKKLNKKRNTYTLGGFLRGHLHLNTSHINMRQYGNVTLLGLDKEDAKAKMRDCTTDINVYSDTEYIYLL